MKGLFSGHLLLTFLVTLNGLTPSSLMAAEGSSPVISLETTWKYIPADSNFIIWIDAQAIRKSPIFPSLVSLITTGKKDVEEFLSTAGLEPDDVAGVVFAGNVFGDKSKNSVAALISTNKPMRIDRVLEAIKQSRKGKVKTFRSKVIGEHDVYTDDAPEPSGLCLLNDRLLLMTDSQTTGPILNKSNLSAPKFFDNMSEELELNSMIFAVAAPRITKPDDLMAKVDTVGMQAELGEMIKVKAVLRCLGEREAGEMRKSVGFFVTLAGSVQEGGNAMNEFLGTVSIAGTGSNVVITSNASPELWSQVLKSMTKDSGNKENKE